MSHIISPRPTGFAFDALAAGNNDKFVFFGPLFPGDSLRSVTLTLFTAANAADQQWVLDFRLFENRPSATAASWVTGISMRRPGDPVYLVPPNFFDPSNNPSLQDFLFNFSLPGGVQYRYAGFSVNASFMQEATTCYGSFDVEFARPLHRKPPDPNRFFELLEFPEPLAANPRELVFSFPG